VWLRSHIHSHGLFRFSARSDDDTFLTKEQTEASARDISIALRPEHLSNRLIPCVWGLRAVYTMIDTGVWDDLCRSRLDEALKDDRALDGLTLMLYGSGYTTEHGTVAKICSLEPFLASVRRRLETTGSDSLHETVLVALRKATSGGF
jgi:hypothetical protein